MFVSLSDLSKEEQKFIHPSSIGLYVRWRRFLLLRDILARVSDSWILLASMQTNPVVAEPTALVWYDDQVRLVVRDNLVCRTTQPCRLVASDAPG